MARTAKPISSEIAWSSADRIVVRGFDLPSEVLGRMNLAEFSFLQLTGRRPTAEQGRVYNALLITLVEHGLTPSALAARLTYTGAPESMQAAVAAGLCGLGSVFVGSMEDAARMLDEGLAGGEAPDEAAARIVSERRARGQLVPGIGHPFHKPVDPRAPRLFEIAAECGLSGAYVELMQKIAAEAERQSGRTLPCNATGAIAALSGELGLPWTCVRGLGVMARAIGLVGHLMEEAAHPIGNELWRRADEEASGLLRAESDA